MRRRGFAGSSPGAWRKVPTKNAAHAAARGESLTSWPILPDSRPSVGRGVPPPEIREWAEKSSHSSLRGASATKQSRAAAEDWIASLHVVKLAMTSRSRGASQRHGHCEERKRRSNPGQRLRLDCFASHRKARNDEPFSRCVSAPEL